ncbi:hypothetical protein B0H11DRAFT_365669 [Mycena galericulata]|nr:hypothetical protein B0H11DRAFT_365669 [Mycena galericulata]
MPQLWSSLRLFPRYPGSDLPAFLDLLQLCIPRAGKHLLDLEVSRFPTESTMAILSHLAHYSHQWRTLRLTFHSSSPFPNDKIRGQVPCLTKLSINIIGGYSVPEVVPAVTAFSDAPHLRDVQLSGVSFRSLSLPWIQLTSLTFSGASASNCVQILERTPNLEVLSINLSTTSHSFNPRLTLLHLHTLSFQCDRDDMLLDCLTLPALKTIELSVPESVDGLFSLPGLAYRSQWSLRSIRLVGLHSVASTFCLLATRSVEEVDIRHCSTIWRHESLDELVSLLENKDFFLPNVRLLKLTNCTVKVSASSLAAMLTSRWDESREGIAKLETFHLLFEPDRVPGKYLEEIKSQMRPLQDMGLVIVVGESADD